jgi:hypothetical protein
MNVGFHAGLGPCSITSDMKEPRTNRLQPATCRDGAFHFPLPARQEIQSYFSLPPEQRDSSEIYVHSKLKKNSGGLHKLIPTHRATIYIYIHEYWKIPLVRLLMPEDHTFVTLDIINKIL